MLYVILSILSITRNIKKYEVNGKTRQWTLGILSFVLTALSTFIGTAVTGIIILTLVPGLEQELLEATWGRVLDQLIIPLPAAILSIIYIPKMVFRTATRNRLRPIPEPVSATIPAQDDNRMPRHPPSDQEQESDRRPPQAPAAPAATHKNRTRFLKAMRNLAVLALTVGATWWFFNNVWVTSNDLGELPGETANQAQEVAPREEATATAVPTMTSPTRTPRATPTNTPAPSLMPATIPTPPTIPTSTTAPTPAPIPTPPESLGGDGALRPRNHNWRRGQPHA